MRVEPFTVGSHIHVLKGGARKMDITAGESEKWRFIRLLYYMNDKYVNEYWERETSNNGLFYRPVDWPNQEKIVEILAYCLMPNHFHLILKEIKEGGISLFMKKLAGSMSIYFNRKHDGRGSIFQGPYKSRTIHDDTYFRYLAAYVMVKNSFELYPNGGLESARHDFEGVWNWALTYPFSSLADYSGKRKGSVVLQKGLLGELFDDPQYFKSFARDCILGRKLEDTDFLEV